MSDIHALSGAYVTHGLDDVERARFERHLRECPACADEVEGLREAVVMLAETTMTAPPAGLRARVLRDISTVRPLAPHVPTAVVRRPRRLVHGLAAAAAAVVLAGTGAAVWHPWTDDSRQSPSYDASAQQVISAKGTKHSKKEFPGGGVFMLYRNPGLGRAVLVSTHMSTLPEGRVYELWLKHGDDYVPAGTFGNDQTAVLFEGDANAAIGAAVTVEPAGGSQSPTSLPIAEFPFEQA